MLYLVECVCRNYYLSKSTSLDLGLNEDDSFKIKIGSAVEQVMRLRDDEPDDFKLLVLFVDTI